MAGCYAVFHKQLGDLVLLEPALSRLRAHHGSPVRVMTRNGHADLLSLMPGVVFVKGLALQPVGTLYCFDPLNKSALRSVLAPVLKRHLIPPERAELQWYHRFLFPRPTNPELGDSYVARFFWENTPVPTGEPFRPPLLNKPPSEWAPGGWEPGSYILLNPTAGWRKKTWTPEGWAAVLGTLGSRYRIVLTNAGAGWQQEHCERIAAATSATIQATSLRQFLWLCANARAVLTVDGSASHLASAFGVDCFTLFGPTHMPNWHLPGPRHTAFQAPPDKDGVHRLRRLEAGPVIQTLAALGL